MGAISAMKTSPLSPDCKIGWDWPVVEVTSGPFKGRRYARGPQGQMVRIKQEDLNREVVNFIKQFGINRDATDE